MNFFRIRLFLPSRHTFAARFPLLFSAGWMIAASLTAASLTAFAQGTHLWSQTRFDEYEKGTPSGVSITSDGKLRRGPAATEILTTPSTFVWSIAVDKNKPGTSYLATGSPATVLRVSADGKSTRLFETKALAVQVVRLGPDGSLYAATIPDGKVYRLKPDASDSADESKAEVVFDLAAAQDGNKPAPKADSKEPKARYIWDLTFDSAGRLYIATGGPAAIYRLDLSRPKPEPEAFFKSDEQHIRSLTWDRSNPAGNALDAKANLIAGSDGSGLIYRISPEGKGYVLFSAPRREVTALAVGADGVIYEADVGDKSHSPLPPIPVQAGGGGSITISFVQPGSLQAANASTALPDGTEIYALAANQAPRRLWAGKDEIVYALASAAEGLTALTGNRGRILTIHTDGTYADVAHLEAQQATSMAATADGWLIGTANTGKLFRLGVNSKSSDQDHVYSSDVLDAGASARWGRVEVDPGSHGYQIFTRSGNVEQPARNEKDWGWSDWQPLSADKVISPVGRYLQWKASLAADGVVSGVGINFLAVNAAPAIDEIIVVPGARYIPQSPPMQAPQVTIAFPNPAQSQGLIYDANAAAASSPIQAQKDRTAVTVRWNAHDENGDDLSYDLFVRRDETQSWWPLKKNLTEKVYSFDGSTLPDGGYEIRVVASDSPSHTPGEALTGELTSERFELDTTPPVISDLVAGAVKTGPEQAIIPVTFVARDVTSPISHAEYSIDAGKWQFIEPVGQLSDSKEEHYSFNAVLSLKGEEASAITGTLHLITVRAYDRHDNMATAQVVIAPGSSAK